MKENKKKLYDALSADYDMGTFEEFSQNVNDDEKRRKLYNAIINEYDLGDYEAFTTQLLGAVPAPADKSQYTFTGQQLGLEGEPLQRPERYMRTQQQTTLQTPMWGTITTGESKSELARDMGESDGRGGISEYIEMLSGVKSEGQEKMEEQLRTAKERAARGETNLYPYGDTQRPLVAAPDIRVKTPWEQNLTNLTHEMAADKAVERAEEGLKPATDAWTQAQRNAFKEIERREREAKKKKAAEDAVGEMREKVKNLTEANTVRRFDPAFGEEISFNFERAPLTAADLILSQTEKMVEDFAASREMGGWANLGRSMATTVFDPKTWDIGLSDMLVADQLLSVVEKADKGEALSDSEQLLLDAAINQQVMQGYYGELSNWQKAGQMFGESLPFMVQIAANPLASLGKYASSKASKAVVRHIAKRVGEKGVKKILAKTAAVTGRMVGDLAGSYGVAMTTNLGNTTADALNRQIGDIGVDYDDNGIARYDGRTNVMDAGRAWRDAVNNQAFEFYSEQMGAYFSPVLKGLGKIGGKTLNGFGMQGVNRWVSDFAKKGNVQLLNQFLDRTQFHGFASEYAEEIANGMLNAAFVGDMTMEEVFGKDNLVDTAIGLSVMGAIGPMVATAGYARAKHKEKQALKAADENGRRLMGHAWESFAEAVRRSKNGEELSVNLRDTLNRYGRRALPGEDMRQIFAYAQAYNRYKAVEEVSAKAVAEGVADERDLEQERLFDEGAHAENKNAVRVEYEEAVNGLGQWADIVENLNNDNALDLADDYEERGEVQMADAIRRFVNARSMHAGMTADIVGQARRELEAATAEIDAIANKKDGNIYSVTLGGGSKGYVTGGTVVTDEEGNIDENATREANEGGYLYVMQEGRVRQLVPEALVSLDNVESAEEAKAMREAEINASFKARYEELTAPVPEATAAPQTPAQETAPAEATAEASPTQTAAAPTAQAAPTASNEVAEDAARALGLSLDELNDAVKSEQKGLSIAAKFEAGGDTDGANAIRAYVAERFGTQAEAAPTQGNNGAENITIQGNNAPENITQAPENVAPALSPEQQRKAKRAEIAARIPTKGKNKQWTQAKAEDVAEYIATLTDDAAVQQATADKYIADIKEKQAKMDAIEALELNDDIAFWERVKGLLSPVETQTEVGATEQAPEAIPSLTAENEMQPIAEVTEQPMTEVQSEDVPAPAGEPVGNSEQLNQSEDNLEMDARSANEASKEKTIGRSLSEQEAQSLIVEMENNAEVAPDIELNIDNWDALFGEDGTVNTPIGEVKMGENQFTKLMRQDRNGKLGMIKPTLENPDAIIEDKSKAKEGDTTERASSYIFVKAFKKADGTRYYYFTSVTVSKDSKEVVISNQEKRRNAIANLLVNGKLVWKHADNVSSASDVANGLYSSQVDSSELATEGTDAPQTNGTINADVPSSADESTTQSANSQENSVKSGENTQNSGEKDVIEEMREQNRIAEEREQRAGVPPRVSDYSSAINAEDTEAQKAWEDKFNDFLAKLTIDDLPTIDGSISSMQGNKEVIKAGDPGGYKENPHYKAFDYIEKALKRRKRELEQSSTNGEKSQEIEDYSITGGEETAPSASQQGEPAEDEKALEIKQQLLNYPNRDLKKLIKSIEEAMPHYAYTLVHTADEQEFAKAERDSKYYSLVLKLAKEVLHERDNGSWRTDFGVKLSYNKDITIEDVKTLFENLNGDKAVGELFNKVYAVAKTLGLKIKISDQLSAATGNAGNDGIVKYGAALFYRADIDNQSKAGTLLHELIHTCTMYATTLHKNRTAGGVISKMYEALPVEIKEACKELERIYSLVKDNDVLKGQYGINSVDEMVAELSNSDFRGKLKEIGLWERIVNAIKRLFDFPITDSQRASDALTEAQRVLEAMLDNFDKATYDEVRNRIQASGRGRKRNLAPKAELQRGSLSLDSEGPAFKAATEKTMQALENTGVEVVMATEEQVKEMMGADFSRAAAPFYSNARKAVLDIKQEKATPEQWVAMLKKNGGLKAGEDAWVGLEAWLGEQQGAVTKQEILDYLAENSIQIEEVEYAKDGEIKTYEELPARSTKVEDWRYYGREQGYVTRFWAADVLGGVNGKVFITRNSLKADGREVFVPKINSRYLQQLDEDFPVYYDTFEDAVDGLNEYFDKHRQRKVNKRTAKAANDTRLEYTTDGLKNKREIALTVPTIEPYNQNDDVHFGDAGGGRAVAWVRFGETTDSEGKRVLVIDEIQSKRHQDGREKGYGRATSEDVKSALEAVNAAQSEFDEYNAEIAKKYGSEYDWNIDATDAEIDKWQELYDKVAQLGQVYEDVAESNRKGIPSAPFEKNWHELAMKRMLRLAAEEGFDKVAWTTGEQQARRYNIGNAVEGIDVAPYKAPDSDAIEWFDVGINAGTSSIDLRVDTDGNIVSGGNREMNLSGEKLASVVGKELAEKIMQPGSFKLEGDGLRIGGEGMKGFYDKMLPSFVQKCTKKWGAKVGEVTMPALNENNTMHSVDVTPEMREGVMQGQPMFLRTSDGTVYGWTVNGKIFLTPEGVNPNTPVHEYTHLWASAIEQRDPELWAEVVEAMKLSPVWAEVMADEAYRDIWNDEGRTASEVLSRLTGNENYRRTMQEAALKESDPTKKFGLIAAWGRVKRVLAKFWNRVREMLDLPVTGEPGSDVPVWAGFVNSAIGDFYGGVNPNVENSPMERMFIGENTVNYTAEEQQIIDRAKADGTYMKAPNGQPTKLSPKQWVQVRTEAFKKWFGDWELAAIETPIHKSKGSFTNLAEAEKWAKKNLQGQSRVNRYTNEEISIGKKSVSEMLNEKTLKQSHSVSVHLAALQSVLDFIETGIPAEIHADTHGRDFNVMRLYNAVEIDGKVYRVKSTVRKVRQGDKFYTYEIQEMELIEERGANPNREGETPHNGNTSNNSITGAKLLNGVKKTNSNDDILQYSKVVDENGEPMVVYHRTPNEFTVFDAEKIGSSTDAGAFGSGFYLSPADFGTLYGKNLMPLFVNLKNPLILNDANAFEVKKPFFGEDYSWRKEQSDNFMAWVKENGHDGVWYDNRGRDEIVATSPNQIKSATDNVGTFGEESDDIRYRSVGGNSGYVGYSMSKRAAEARVNDGITSAVNSLAAELNTDVEIVNEVKDIPDARKRGAKGWYENGRVYIVLPNATSVDDAVETVLHEVVGHKGLRALFGERFNEMLDNVFVAASKEVRKAILERAVPMMASGRDALRVATEEYMAEQAERGFDDYSLFDRIKGWFKNLLNSLGFNVELSDNDIRYMLWRSYNLLRGNNTLAEIENIAMQARLGEGEYRARAEVIDTRFRDASNAQELYNKNVEGFTDRAKEAWIDKTRSVRKMQEAIEKETGEEIADYANVYLLMNQMPGRVREKMDGFFKKHFDPLGEFLKKMFKNDYLKGSEEQKQKQVERYLNCKHGIERNIDMSVRAALTNEEGVLDRKTYEQYTTEKEAIWAKNLPWAEEVKELTELSKKYNAKEKDYSGLTALFPNEDSYKKIRNEAVKSVENFEKAFGENVITELWKRVGDINKLTLKESYESGILSRELYNSINRQFRYYVPLRGFEETTASEVYEYLSREDIPISGPIRRAEGRKSEAERIFATMANMYNSAVSMGAKNRVKQALFQMAVMNKTPLLSVNPSYYKEDGRGGYEPFLPAVTEDMSEDEIRREMEKYEEDVKKGLEDGTIQRHREGLNIDYKSEKWQKDEHAVRVKRNGKEFIVFVNGNPRAAQAINGLLDRRGGKFIQTLQAANRWRARNITGYNVNFTLSNLARDIQEATITAFAKEGLAYTGLFEKELMKNLAAFKTEDGIKYRGIHNLYYRYFNDKLDLTNKREKYFKEFMENGGETGFHSMMSIEDYQKRIKKIVDSNLLNATGKGFAAVNDTVEFLNRGIENACRFATYVASRESGKSVMQSVNDAKEASVNFNRVGSGAMGNLYFRASKMFLNPAIQGLVKRLTLLRDYPARMIPIVAMELLTGYIVGDLAMMAMKFIWDALGVDDDDEENNAYYNLSDFVRRSNVVIPLTNGKFIKIPLSHESRVAHGIGEILSSYMNGHLEYENIPAQLYGVLTQSIPLNPTAPYSFTEENLLEDIAKVVIPDAFALPAYEALVLNRDFTGRSVTGRSDYNEHRPEYMRAGRGTPKFFIEMSRAINDWTGGSDIERGVLENAVGGVNNPTFYEYMLMANLGGIATMTAQIYKTVQAVKGDEEYQEARNYPIINRFFEDTSSYEEKPQKRTRRDYERAYRFFNEKTKDYSNIINNDKAAEKMGIDGLEDERRRIETEKMEEKRDAFKPHREHINDLYNDLNKAKDEKNQSRIEELEKEILDAKIWAVKEMEKVFNWE